ncbi:FecR domain-containing protein [Variovorax guangxiensis]|uniref:LysM peptidoglycan-binding domain-containing protein n=1 Tax=Variovorax guangxiensis TaxID=1775474 RepID=A0A502DHE0_9BURK|nr:FecR domain-containing protein [Variovorax guangxiensis]TPG20230.1 LysM peptidoglycan-binding domain-containing protein [Variovorax ginsengisoli]TPG23889.1 LysM peptidoglycan-binding domain-containing protein [Variovorax guangxiensis]
MNVAARLRLRTQAVLLACALVVGGAHAAAPSRGELRHRVVVGDTLQALGERYLRVPSQWRELQAINRIADPDTLKAGSLVRIPRTLLRPADMATAKVEFVQGHAVGVLPAALPAPAGRAKGAPAPPPAADASEPLVAGDAVSEGTRIQVPKDGYLRLRLADGSVVRVLAESDVELKRLRSKRPSGGRYESVIDVRRGKVESDVAPQPKGRLFEIHAPGAVASVRGTRFDVAVSAEGRVSTSVAEGVVKVQPRKPKKRSARSADVRAGEGAIVEADGQLDKRATLPPAPDLSSLPAVVRDANMLILHLAAPDSTLAGYEVRIARSDDMREVLRNGLFETGRVQFTALDDGDYVVGVRAFDRDGLAGAETRRALRVHARPVPPLYQAPAPGARITSDAGQLVCSDVAGANAQLQVSRSIDFATLVLDETRTGDCRLGVAALAPGDYWWRVASIARDAGGTLRRGPFAAPQPFTVALMPSVGTVQVEESGESPTLRWQAEGGVSFRAQLARDADFRQPLLDVELTTPTWTIAGPPRGNYYVRLQARDASGLVGAFSPARRVRIGPVVSTSDGGILHSGDGALVDRP